MTDVDTRTRASRTPTPGTFARADVAALLALAAPAVSFLPALTTNIHGSGAAVTFPHGYAVMLVVTVGQASFFLAVLFVGGLAVLPRRPLLAGVLFGFLTVKPQLGLLLPAALLIMGEYRAFATASIAAGLLVALSLVLFGLGPWDA